MRPTTGTRACSLRYSRSDASVSICIASTPGCTSRGSNPTGACSNSAVRLPLASTSTSRTRLPLLGREQRGGRGDRALADAALPVKKSRRRSSRSGARAHAAGARLAAEADALRARRRRRPRRRRSCRPGSRPAALGVGDPARSAVPSASASSIVADDVVGGSVELEGELLGGVHDTDAKFHGAESSGDGRRPLGWARRSDRRNLARWPTRRAPPLRTSTSAIWGAIRRRAASSGHGRVFRSDSLAHAHPDRRRAPRRGPRREDGHRPAARPTRPRLSPMDTVLGGGVRVEHRSLIDPAVPPIATQDIEGTLDRSLRCHPRDVRSAVRGGDAADRRRAQPPGGVPVRRGQGSHRARRGLAPRAAAASTTT